MTDTAALSRNIRKRAARSRRIHNLILVLMVLLVLGLAVIYVSNIGLSLESGRELSDASITLLVLSVSIVRIGAVIVGIYGVQLMFNFARYHIRVAHYLEATADALELSEGDVTKLETLQRTIVPMSIDFGRAPVSPGEKMVDIVRDLVSKLPGQPKE